MFDADTVAAARDCVELAAISSEPYEMSGKVANGMRMEAYASEDRQRQVQEEHAGARLGKTKLLAVAICLSLGVALTACDPIRPIHFSIQINEDLLTAHVCEPVVVTDLGVAVPQGWPRVEREAWRASGRARFEPGDEFELLQDAPAGLSADSSTEVVLADVEGLFITVSGSPAGGSVYDVSDLAPGEWLRWDGSVSTEPCPSDGELDK